MGVGRNPLSFGRVSAPTQGETTRQNNERRDGTAQPSTLAVVSLVPERLTTGGGKCRVWRRRL